MQEKNQLYKLLLKILFKTEGITVINCRDNPEEGTAYIEFSNQNFDNIEFIFRDQKTIVVYKNGECLNS